MTEEYQIVYKDEPEWGIIEGGIHHYNIEQAGADNDKNLCFVLQDPGQVVVGGVIGQTHWN